MINFIYFILFLFFMARCKVCGKKTKFNYPLCRKHFYFNIRSPRFYISFILTIFTYFFLPPISVSDFQKIIFIHVLKAFFEYTQNPLFLLFQYFFSFIIFVLNLMFFNYLVYMFFCSKKAKLPIDFFC